MHGWVPILVGGASAAAVRRTVEHGVGWTAGGMPLEAVAESALRSPEAVLGAVEAYRKAGVTELVVDAAVSDPTQVDLLAEVVLG